MSTYYVANTGSDSDDGSESTPFETILKASTVLEAGDTCFIYDGNYHEEIFGGASGTEGSPITYLGESRDGVVITGTDSPTWTQQGSVWYAGPYQVSYAPNAFVYVDETYKLELGTSETLAEGYFYLDGDGIYFVRLPDDENPNNHIVDVHDLTFFFNVGERWGGTAKSWITLKNLTLEKYFKAISSDKDNPGNNAFWELDNICVRYGAWEGIFSALDDWYIHDCLFDKNGNVGCQLEGARILFENNICRYTEWWGQSGQGGSGVLLGPTATAHDCIVRNNNLSYNGPPDLYGGYGCGVYLEGLAYNNLIEKNIITNNTQCGVSCNGGSDSIIINNLIIDTSIGLSDRSSNAAFVLSNSWMGDETVSQGNLIANNTIWNSLTPVMPKLSFSAEGRTTNRIVNNLFYNCDSMPINLSPYGYIVFERNAFYNCFDAATPEDCYDIVKEWLDDGSGYYELQFPPGISHELLCGSDPGLVDPENSDFSPGANSSILELGIRLVDVTDDYDGKTRPSMPAIGALEYLEDVVYTITGREVIGKTLGVNISNATLTTIISNPPVSDNIIKINFLLITNTASAIVPATLYYYNNATPGNVVGYPFIKAVRIPANASLVIVDKPSYLYLSEDTSIGIISGNSSGYLTIICSYEILAYGNV